MVEEARRLSPRPTFQRLSSRRAKTIQRRSTKFGMMIADIYTNILSLHMLDFDIKKGILYVL